MKREIDLCRQILFDLEAKGSDCATTVLRSDVSTDTDQRVRYHLRLLIDAGLVKEVERSTSTTTCVRMTNNGHEFLELCRIDARWHEAKQVVRHRTGGMSLSVLKAVLTKWAVEDSAAPRRRVRRVVRPYDYQYERYEPIAREYREGEILRDERDTYDDEAFAVVRTRPDYRERFDYRESVAELNGHGYATRAADTSVEVTLPIYMV